MSPTFRSATSEEVPEVAWLAAHSFPALGRTLAEWEASLRSEPRGGVEMLWVGEEAGKLIAACRLFRMRQWIGGELLPVMGLGTVAIAPTERRRGLGGQLCVSGFRHALERGDLATTLYPFRTSFYQRLGYGMAGEALQFQIPPDALPDAEERRAVRLVRGEDDRAAVRAVYDQWAPRQTGQMQRDAAAWQVVWEAGREGALYLGTGGAPEGYAIFRYRASVPRGGRGVEVEEIAWLTAQARRGLHGWLSTLGDQWQHVIYRAHPEEAFAERLRELRHPVADVPPWHYWFAPATLQTGPMFRLLDVPGAWARRRARAERPLTVHVEVEDEQLPENRGPWALRFGGEMVEVERASTGRADAHLALRVDTLSRIFIGALAPSVAVEADRMRIDDPAVLPELDRALRLPRPWTFDRF